MLSASRQHSYNNFIIIRNLLCGQFFFSVFWKALPRCYADYTSWNMRPHVTMGFNKQGLLCLPESEVSTCTVLQRALHLKNKCLSMCWSVQLQNRPWSCSHQHMDKDLLLRCRALCSTAHVLTSLSGRYNKPCLLKPHYMGSHISAGVICITSGRDLSKYWKKK